MFCLLGEPEDRDILWLAAALERRRIEVELVLPEELMIGSTLTCRTDDHAIGSSLRLHDGRTMDPYGPELVINRMVDLPPIGGTTSAADARYLGEEWRAAVAAWLRTLRCPMLNPPRAASLSGPTFSPAAWRAIASAHGLACRTWSSNQEATAAHCTELVCVGTDTVDPSGVAPPAVRTALAEMARFVGAPLLGATFDRSDNGWMFLEATPRPRLSCSGEELVGALTDFARLQREPA